MGVLLHIFYSVYNRCWLTSLFLATQECTNVTFKLHAPAAQNNCPAWPLLAYAGSVSSRSSVLFVLCIRTQRYQVMSYIWMKKPKSGDYCKVFVTYSLWNCTPKDIWLTGSCSSSLRLIGTDALIWLLPADTYVCFSLKAGLWISTVAIFIPFTVTQIIIF